MKYQLWISRCKSLSYTYVISINKNFFIFHSSHEQKKISFHIYFFSTLMLLLLLLPLLVMCNTFCFDSARFRNGGNNELRLK